MNLLRLVRGSRRFRWRERLLEDVVTTLDGRDFHFRCASDTDVWRARSLSTKEAGTIEWIRNSVQAGEVFCDIGANIGLYSLVAAARVGSSGKVFSFEPHAENFVSLMRNIAANRFGDVIHPLSCALHDREGTFDFNYNNMVSGSSMSQLGGTKDGDENEFAPVFRECKLGVRLDTLVFDWGMPAPTHIKIDVDGNELSILQGMQRVLSSPSKPRTLQVEINQRYRDALFDFMRDQGYEKYHRHDTENGKKLLAEGKDPELVAYNALFKPA
jgi:FkbM family methyltransferase